MSSLNTPPFLVWLIERSSKFVTSDAASGILFDPLCVSCPFNAEETVTGSFLEADVGFWLAAGVLKAFLMLENRERIPDRKSVV